MNIRIDGWAELREEVGDEEALAILREEEHAELVTTAGIRQTGA